MFNNLLIVYLITFLAVLWLLLSGHYTPLLLALGAASCLLVWYISDRMDLVDHEEHPLHLRPVKLVLYWIWLCGQVVISNVDVARRIIDPKLPIHPRLMKVRTSQRTELGQVIYANSITLTPGTVSLRVEGDEIVVHALTREAAEELQSGKMDRQVTRTEGRG